MSRLTRWPGRRAHRWRQGQRRRHFQGGQLEAVTAAPNAGYIFATWTENGAVVSGSASYAFTLRGDQDLVANFIPNPFPAISGAYNGLFCDETNGVSPAELRLLHDHGHG